MPIIFISGLPFGGGEKLALTLAKKLGYDFLGREGVVAKANECRIPVGKLEVAMVKKPVVHERLAHLRDRYLAVATATICEKAAKGNLVYYGRAGHLLLPGVSHVLRVRVVPEPGERLKSTMQRLKLDGEKAQRFLDEIDGDIETWVRFVHGVDMGDPHIYDFVINLENMAIENAATALCGIADLPDFRPTPASRSVMESRLLVARARIKLALEERTADADLTVRSNEGILTVTYMPRQASLAPLIPEVIGDVSGCREIRCTMASTNLLWVQESFDAASESFREVNELARRWGAAVEIVQYRSQEETETEIAHPGAPKPLSTVSETGGVEEDAVESASEEETSFNQTLEALILEGRSGGGQRVAGSREALLSSLPPTVPYSLVVVGNLFLGKPSATRVRLTRELSTFLTGRLKTPVLSTSELGGRLRFGRGELGALAAGAAVVAGIYGLAFLKQKGLLDILGGSFHAGHRWVAPVLVCLVVPVVASLLGKITGALLKLAKLA